jgi:hypothetical protein
MDDQPAVEEIILIDGGDVFEGTLAQFSDCFFTDADIEQIEQWAEENNMKFEVRA